MSNEHTILVEQNGDGTDRCEIVCAPFEPDDPEYAGERWLAIFWDGNEESFVVLKAEDAKLLAALLVTEAGR